jgi:hypothetical protein
MPVKSSADKLVSQSTAGSQSSGGDIAQNVPASFAVAAPNMCPATRMMAATVNTPNIVCSAMIKAAEAKL